MKLLLHTEVSRRSEQGIETRGLNQYNVIDVYLSKQGGCRGENMYEIVYHVKNPNEKEERKHTDYYDDDTNINAVKQSLKERGAKNIKVSTVSGRR